MAYYPINNGFPPAKVLEVAIDGRAYTTIQSAISAASLLSPSVSNPLAILVYPGVYNENNPLTLPSYVSLVGTDGEHDTIITAQNSNSPLIYLGASASINNFTLTGANGVNGIGLCCLASGLASSSAIQISNCTTGVCVSGINTRYSSAYTRFSRVSGETMHTAIRVLDGANADTFNTHIEGSTNNPISIGYYVDGSGSHVDMLSTEMELTGSGLYVNNSASLWASSARIEDPGTAILVGTGTVDLGLSGIVVEDSTSYDIYTTNTSAIIRTIGCTFRHDKVVVSAATDKLLFYSSTTPGNKAIHVIGELAVGTELTGTESSFGGGDSHTRNMVVQTNTNAEAGTWAIETTPAETYGFPAFQLFPGLTANNAVYIGGDTEFPGVEVITISGMAIGAGAMALEIWDGVTWSGINYMSSDANTPYNQYAKTAFTRVNTENIRFAKITGWTTKALNSSTKYWARYRLTNTITTAPVVQQIKLHTNSTSINTDGRLEYFGTSRPLRSLSWHRNLLDPLSGSTPANANIGISANIVLGATQNVFANGAVDSFGALVSIPEGLDTSRSLELHINWYATGNTGFVELQVNYAVVSKTATIGALAETALSNISPPPATTSTLKETVFYIDVSSAQISDFLALQIYRDGGAGNADDTMNGNVVIVDTHLEGYFWK